MPQPQEASVREIFLSGYIDFQSVSERGSDLQEAVRFLIRPTGRPSLCEGSQARALAIEVAQARRAVIK